MTDVFAPQAPVKQPRDKAQLIGGLLVAFAGLLAVPDLVRFAIAIGPYINYAGFSAQIFLEFVIEFMAVAVVGLGLTGALVQKKLIVVAAGIWFAARILLSIISALMYGASNFVDLLGLWNWDGWLSFISVFVATGGAIISLVLKTSAAPAVAPQYIPPVVSEQVAAPVVQQQSPSTSPGWYFDPSVGGPRYWDGSAWLNIPAPVGTQNLAGSTAQAPGIAVAALVLSLLMPLVGLIVGYVARNQAKVSANPQAGAGLIKAAITIGWIFTILGVVGGVIYGVAMGAMLANDYSY